MNTGSRVSVVCMMPDELSKIATPVVRRRSPIVVLGVVVLAVASLLVLLAIVAGLGWDGY